MKTKSTKAAFFNLRVLIGFALCLAGLLISLAGLSKSVTRVIAATPTGNTDHQFHHYKLIDLGTFGGPASYYWGNEGSLNSRETAAGSADTSSPDPFPAFCFDPDCYLAPSFQV